MKISDTVSTINSSVWHLIQYAVTREIWDYAWTNIWIVSRLGHANGHIDYTVTEKLKQL
jgi:hypothetical protein